MIVVLVVEHVKAVADLHVDLLELLLVVRIEVHALLEVLLLDVELVEESLVGGSFQRVAGSGVVVDVDIVVVLHQVSLDEEVYHGGVVHRWFLFYDGLASRHEKCQKQ